ncbi:hypothetical protein PISMIDRAFT_237246 [Pisolithus microcarpus 441]|uniref:Uncharacterized protein n=1 Tax=Pisolithus microcarpus 441 TaxID=765257 RepID=A0A0C9YKB0_9AGAM|nr:hypothetical protein PISMIDRAFT_237246 [Pisolithus microcarpus 441]
MMVGYSIRPKLWKKQGRGQRRDCAMVIAPEGWKSLISIPTTEVRRLTSIWYVFIL